MNLEIPYLLCAVVLLAGVLSCRAPSNGTPAPAPSAAPTASVDASAPDAAAPPPVERACSRDEDCAVARVEVTGERACCWACGTTPGTRRWHAALQRWCGAHPPASCPPLACPAGPSRAVCEGGVCKATWKGADGGPMWVPVERRCLPELVCDAWVGCAAVSGNGQDGWFVEEADRGAKGEAAAVENVCTAGERCEAARVTPEGVTCPPHTVPPVIRAPEYRCAVEAGKCKRVAGK